MIHVFGHTNPDTDAILSAILFSKLLSLQGKEATPYRLGEINNETKYCLSALGRDLPEMITSLPAGSIVALTDHNEKTQTIGNIDELKVVSIIDHHKFAFTTTEPIEINVQPIASTCSVLYKMWVAAGHPIGKEEATAMIMGLVSDTLYFRSPTTTAEDKAIFIELQKIAEIKDPEAFSLEMFAAKSDLGDINVRDLITLDYKVFEVNGKQFAGGAIETTNPSYTLGRKDEIVQELLAMKQEAGLSLIMLSVVDILNEKNTTIVPSQEDAEIIKSVFGAETVDHIADLGNRISRKKQLSGPLTEYFTSL